jgi:hypothetical protein
MTTPTPRQTAALLARLLRDHATADELPAVDALASAAAGTDAAALRAAHQAVGPIVERLSPPAPPPSGARRGDPRTSRYRAACAAADEAAFDLETAERTLLAAREALTLASLERRMAYAALPASARGAA